MSLLLLLLEHDPLDLDPASRDIKGFLSSIFNIHKNNLDNTVISLSLHLFISTPFVTNEVSCLWMQTHTI